jgi:hypothetical protein
MGRREEFSVGQLYMVGISTDVSTTDTVLVLARNAAGDIILCSGSTIPTAGDSGFAIGCIFVKSNTGTIYLNGGAGTATSCAFALLGSAVAPGAITATELASNAVAAVKILAGAVTPVKMGVLTKVTEATDGGITVLAADLLKGYLEKTNCTVGGKTLTFDTAVAIQAAFVATTGAWFDWEFSNISTQTITLTLGVGVTLKGTAAVPTGKTAKVRFINTGAGAIDAVIGLAA